MFNLFRRSSKSAPAAPDATPSGRAATRASSPTLKATFGDAPAMRSPAGTVSSGSPAAGAKVVSSSQSPAGPHAGLSAAASLLSPDAQRILAQLPASVSLAQTCARYPQAVEKLLKHWRNPKEFRLTIDSMLIDTRGGRQGFPFGVLNELGMLREHYDLRVDPVKTNAWASIDVR